MSCLSRLVKITNETGRSGGKAGKMEESFGGLRNAHQQKEN